MNIQIKKCSGCGTTQKVTELKGTRYCKSCGNKFSYGFITESELNDSSKEEATKPNANVIRPYIPNNIPIEIRAISIGIIIILSGFIAFSLITDDMLLLEPFILSRWHTNFHLHGTNAIIVAVAYIALVLSRISVIADHFDKRDNEFIYVIFELICYIVFFLIYIYIFGWLLLRYLR